MNDNDIIQQYKKYEPIFGSWYIKRFIGEGGFAKVFEITRNEFGVEYTSALKIITISKTKSEINTLRSEGMSDDDIRGYMRGIVEDTVSEIQLMYKLRGRGNIVSYEDHALAEHEDSMGWDILIKMEYLTSLSTYIRQQNGQLAKRDIIKLGADICKALEHCQRYNIIHRDIKADNIFISDDGEFKLGDFGIARVIERKDQTLSKKGTSAYMAPEVYKGQTYTAAVDIYSLGIVMYRLMNNNRGPFLPPYPQPMSLDDRDHAMMLRMSGEKFTKPSQVTGGRLVEIVLKACAYRPEDRYSSPGFMRQELEAIYLDKDEMTTDEKILIYDEQMRSATSSFSQDSGAAFGNNKSAAAAKTPGEDDATEVLREDDATEVLREDDATEILRPESDYVSAQSMLSRARKTCTNCGNSIEYNAVFCSFCGAGQQEKPEQPQSPAAVEQPQPSAEAEQLQQPSAENEQSQPPAEAEQFQQPAEAEQSQQLAEAEQSQPSAENEQSQPPTESEQLQSSVGVEQPQQPAEVEKPQPPVTAQSQPLAAVMQPQPSVSTAQPQPPAAMQPKPSAVPAAMNRPKESGMSQDVSATEAMGREIQDFLRNQKGMKTVGWSVPEGYRIDAESENPALNIVGLGLSQSVKIYMRGDDVCVQSEPRWASKVILWVALVFWFIFFLCVFFPIALVIIPFIVCVVIGICRQNQLTKEISDFAHRSIAGGKRIPGVNMTGGIAQNTQTPVQNTQTPAQNIQKPMIKCPHCQAMTVSGKKFCMHCGGNLDMTQGKL